MASLKVTILSVRYLFGSLSALSSLQSDVVITLDFRKPAICTPVVYSILPEKAVAAPKAKTLPKPPLLADRAIDWLRAVAATTDHLHPFLLNKKGRGMVAIVGSRGEVWTTTRERLNSRLLAMAA